MALGMVTAGSRTSSPSVAIRAYPANAKNRNPAERRTPPTVVSIGVIRDSDVVEADHPATITVASAVIATINRHFVTATVRDRPPMLTTATRATAMMATGRAWSGHRYSPAVSANATQDAVLPTMKLQPARCPHDGESCRRANT